jgi:Tfp pilus assembly protein PilV
MDWLLHRRKGRQKGSALIEAIIALGLLAYLILGYAQSSAQASKVQRTNINHTIATQEAAAFIETLRASPWSKIGVAGVTAVSGRDVMDLDSVAGGAIASNTKVAPRGLDLTLNTTVIWAEAPTPGRAYGVKKIKVTATWFDRTGDPKSKRVTVQESILTPGIDQAAPSGVRGSV